MPLHKHEPVPEKEMNWISPKNTICETLRQAYSLIQQAEDQSIQGDIKHDEAMLKIREATSMAKSMSAKLEGYSRNWKDEFFDNNDKFPLVMNKKPIDVLFLCWDDNANTGYRFWMCAKHLGLNAVMFKGKSHAFGYPQQAPIHPSLANNPIYSAPVTMLAPGIESLINSAQVVHLIASTYPMCGVNWSKHNVVVQHGGTVYRQNPEACNEIFNQFADKAVIQMPDLMGLGAKNEHWIYYPVDTEALKPDFSPKGDKVVVGHFPSNPVVKGSDVISRVIIRLQKEGLPFEYIGTNDRVSWSDNLGRMRKCDIVIEGCNALQGGKAYGEWGNVALEASALGCAVVTHCRHQKMYEKEFGELGPVIANNEGDLEFSLRTLITKKDLRPIKERCRDWAVKNHSIPVTANRLWDLVYKDFF